MPNEIKEILNQLEKVKDGVGTFIGIDNKNANLLLDYITNLRTIEQQYSALLSENADLKEELNKYKFPDCKTKDIEVVRANLVDMMRKNKRLEQENERLKENKLTPDELVNLLNQELIKQRDDYKSRCEKATNLLKNKELNYFSLETIINSYLERENKLLNILQESDNEVLKEIIDKNTMIYVNGKNFHCSCGANVFTKYSNNTFKCNACNNEYNGGDKDGQ